MTGRSHNRSHDPPINVSKLKFSKTCGIKNHGYNKTSTHIRESCHQRFCDGPPHDRGCQRRLSVKGQSVSNVRSPKRYLPYQDDDTKTSSREQQINPVFNLCYLHVIPRRNDTRLVQATVQLDNDFPSSMVVDDLEFTDVACRTTRSVIDPITSRAREKRNKCGLFCERSFVGISKSTLFWLTETEI